MKPTAAGVNIKINFIETTSHFTVDAPNLEGVNAIFRAQTWSAYNLMHPPTITSTIKSAGKECELVEATITVTNNNHMPVWPYYEKADLESKRSWNRFYEDAVIHENGHRAIAREFTVILREKLTGIGPKPCELLDQWFAALQGQAWKQLRERQEAYDRQTNHGQTQNGRR